ncbi:restriction endonuclease subunit S [Methanosarcina sp. WH1]|uniref:restriction endonuclease subunit S n=1 Tax=Methanosarcina sp. WH1 TaxID=1434102 RepID=UPI000615C6C2|nr:restriction endonuclease subunit S [Methanosarcina sp. WH1]AKB21490.1 Type I restriction-modification system, specificity subunit S [Methanosarcina sp. WH1]
MNNVLLETVILSLESGARPKGGVSADSGEIPSIGGEHLTDDGNFDFSNIKRIPTSFFKKMKSGHVCPLDILIVKDGATTGKTSFVHPDFPFKEAAVNEHVFSVRVNPEKAVPAYICHFLRSAEGKKAILRDFRGATVGGISREFAAKVILPLPSLPEQQRVVDILDRAEALRAKRRAALAQLDELVQSIFIEMFGDSAINPKGWSLKPVGELASKFSDGPFGSNIKSSHYTENGIRVVRLQNIGVGEFLDDDKAYISEEHFAELKKHECLPGDVLVGTLGSPNLRACIQPDWLNVAINKADCIQFRPDERIVNAPYICSLLNQPATEKMAQDLMLGQTRLRISMGRLRGLEVPLPPLNLQQEFACRVVAVEKLKIIHKASLADLDALFASLQYRAFRGEL